MRSVSDGPRAVVLHAGMRSGYAISERMSINELKSNNATTLGLLHRATGYDLGVWLMTFGRERRLRARVLDLARLATGERVLDIGCGTGTLAIAASARVGTRGSVAGIDASAAMIARARRKARWARADVRFESALAQALPYADGSLDVVLCTIMLHHLPRAARVACLAEVRRVLAPHGRLLVVDFATSPPRGIGSRFHRRHGHVAIEDLANLLDEGGFRIVERGPFGAGDLHYALACLPREPFALPER